MEVSKTAIDRFKEDPIWLALLELAQEQLESALVEIATSNDFDQIRKDQGRIEILKQIEEWPDIVYSQGVQYAKSSSTE